MYRVGTGHMSIFIINNCLLMICLSNLASAGSYAAPTPAVGLAQVVDRLGTAGNSDASDVAMLARTPSMSTKLLIESLRTIDDSEETAKRDSPQTEHVLWLIRALRFITGGVDQCATSNHQFGSSEEEKHREYWLTFGHGNCLTFFALWPSRDRIFIAPNDAQQKIITAWKHWYATLPKDYRFKPFHNPQPEDWLW